MKRHSFFINQVKQFMLCYSLCIGIFLTQRTHAQTTEKKEEKSQFDIPVDNYYNKKIYPKGTGKSFNIFGDILAATASLPAASFSEGPTSGQYIGSGLINQQPVPFPNKQPIQGFSAILNNYDGTFMALSVMVSEVLKTLLITTLESIKSSRNLKHFLDVVKEL